MKLILISFSVIMLFLQTDAKRKYWDESNKLSTLDYNWVYKRPRTDVRAATALGIEKTVSLNNESNKVCFSIRAYANFSDKSWIWMVSSTDTLSTITHEQVHFNIEEIAARKLKKTLSQIKCFKKVNYETISDSLYKKQLSNRDHLHDKFDSLYSLSKNKKALNFEWLDSTQNILADLQLYKSVTIEVNICK